MDMHDRGRRDGRGTSASSERGGLNEQLSSALVAGLSSGGSIDPSLRDPHLTLVDAYAIADGVRRARTTEGARTVGRKIGFTNAELAAAFGAPGPIWGWVYDSTLVQLQGSSSDIAATHSLAGLAEPRLEPEIVLGLTSAPSPDMDERELAACVGWAALGFEVVQSVFADWRFTAAEAVAGHGLHGALIVGPTVPIGPGGDDPADGVGNALAALPVRLERDDEAIATGMGSNAHGGPMQALRWLVDEIDRSGAAPLEAGEVVTTGTLTGAHPIAAGETWRASAVPHDGSNPVSLAVRFA